MSVPPVLTIRPAAAADATALSRVFVAAIETKAREGYGPRERAAWEAEPLAELLRAGFEARSPEATVTVTLTHSAQALALLESGQAALGLVAAPLGTAPATPAGRN